MPRGRETLREYLHKVMERIERVPGDEPWSGLRFPRQEAKKRISNVRKSKRIVITTDEQNFAEFHAMREAYMRYCDENPTLVGLAIIAAMKDFDLKGWLEEQQQEEEFGHTHICQQCDTVVDSECHCSEPNTSRWCSVNCKAAFDL